MKQATEKRHRGFALVTALAVTSQVFVKRCIAYDPKRGPIGKHVDVHHKLVACVTIYRRHYCNIPSFSPSPDKEMNLVTSFTGSQLVTACHISCSWHCWAAGGRTKGSLEGSSEGCVADSRSPKGDAAYICCGPLHCCPGCSKSGDRACCTEAHTHDPSWVLATCTHTHRQSAIVDPCGTYVHAKLVLCVLN